MDRFKLAFVDELTKVAQFGEMLPAILAGGATGGLIGTGAGHVTGKALGKYPGQSRDYGGKAGALTGAVLGAYATDQGQRNKLFKIVDDAKRTHLDARRLGELGKNMGESSLLPKARSWGRFAGRTGKAYLPEAIAGAVAAALLARHAHKRKDD